MPDLNYSVPFSRFSSHHHEKNAKITGFYPVHFFVELLIIHIKQESYAANASVKQLEILLKNVFFISFLASIFNNKIFLF